MKTVILLRHAKSSWADETLEDHERPLNRRGKAAAPLIGAWLWRHGYRPDRALVSSSRRTRQTLKRMRAAEPGFPEAQLEPRLYHADPGVMFEILGEQPDSATSILLLGHQPGLSAFARRLANGHIRPHCARAFQHFPTAAAAVLQIGITRWGDLRPSSAAFIDFARPRDLSEAQSQMERHPVEA
ncbi:MAG: histidine phosphatase family protein [Pseudomonadota bacterium]